MYLFRIKQFRVVISAVHSKIVKTLVLFLSFVGSEFQSLAAAIWKVFLPEEVLDCGTLRVPWFRRFLFWRSRCIKGLYSGIRANVSTSVKCKNLHPLHMFKLQQKSNVRSNNKKALFMLEISINMIKPWS